MIGHVTPVSIQTSIYRVELAKRCLINIGSIDGVDEVSEEDMRMLYKLIGRLEKRREELIIKKKANGTKNM